uniref:Protein kinase domain-containing protein n=1 Tax=Corethron hystrix TaxID=216773 RepID=A0A7S1BTL5_9STRA|mmetsp:Transcript_39057/g.90924  ORF Transcript_39057/g.90924 Transcript_39057/m.90924 type:complete len:436 (+) Transcript_39057:228-1535(+)|eukprot:CAMPEP_0113303164 /NCGR_PEP_ID=MMETSP0010_2-20120614/3692_1 /TAXON_ID=216773 ORGANISM="Corethron hystrix, Strain 308" /NCGR_SAMPLE_ID=MMETSP0010_2 /ASSEMBLY_ACC=CAM_ASM_000155 /LENGTH=435 /DNA_ID=CAMNT_0000157111 /DNA_START=152 /DNA_END=1459 /DNA_ORIENTATION=- /assembly_acc=CAM_ASM_000155
MSHTYGQFDDEVDSTNVDYLRLSIEKSETLSTNNEISSEKVLRERDLSLSGGQRMQRILHSLKKSLADLGDSSRSIGKPKKSKFKKGSFETVDIVKYNTTLNNYMTDSTTSTETTKVQRDSSDLSMPPPKEIKDMPRVRPVIQKKSSFRIMRPSFPTKKPDQPVTIYDRFILKDQIGIGGFSKVFKAAHRLSGRSFAVKRIQLSLMSEKDRKNVKSEVSILRSLNHPSIIKIHDVFQTDPEYVYLVMERVRGGELYNCIVDHGTLSESNARLLCQSILRAVKYCHDQNVVHRDLKPENILLVSKNSYDVKICDFGCAGRLKDHFLSTFCGTINYMSPEMAARRYYDTSVDMWSVGVIIFVSLVGYLPFENDDIDELRRQIIRGDFSFQGSEWAKISYFAKELISAMMNVDPLTRVTADMALLHPWSSPERPWESY